jgi:hypothetical protein
MRTFNKTQRRYPNHDWDYKAISTIMNDGVKKNVIFYTNKQNGVEYCGVEIHQGKNYIVGSSDRSYSKAYTMENLPPKYEGVVSELKSIHEKTEWSNEEYVNEN